MTAITTPKSNWKHKYRSIKRQEDRQEFTGWSENDFINHIFELRGEVEALQKENDKLKEGRVSGKTQGIVTEPLKIEAFKQDWPYSTKFVFLLTLENKPLTSLEIHKHLLKIDKQYSFYNDPKGTLSVYLRAVVKSGRIKAVKLPGIKEKLFVMPEWLDKDGNMKPEFDSIRNNFS